MAESTFLQIKFTDADIVNIDDWIPEGEYNPHNVQPWLLHDHGYILAVVFSDNLQDAIDIAVDEGKLDRYQILETDMKDYKNEEGVSFLGNAGCPHDIETLCAVALINPKVSFCAQFNIAVGHA